SRERKVTASRPASPLEPSVSARAAYGNPAIATVCGPGPEPSADSHSARVRHGKPEVGSVLPITRVPTRTISLLLSPRSVAAKLLSISLPARTNPKMVLPADAGTHTA